MIWVALSDWRIQPRRGGIYVIQNTINGKEYVGQAISLRKRIREHCRALSDQQVHRAVRKYGQTYFRVAILHFETDAAVLNALEIQAIAHRATLNPKGYNLTRGGDGGGGGWKHTEDARRRMSKVKTESNGMRGRVQSPEAREMISEANRRRVMSDATREKFRQVQVGRLSPERAQEIAGRPLLAWLPGSFTPVTFTSVKEAAAWAGITKATMFKWLAGSVRSAMRTKPSDNARAAAAAAWAYARDL